MPQPVTLPDTIYASGKGAAQESFPVASWLLPPSKRADIMAFYRFARAADDIADHPSLPSDEKLRLLDQMEGRLPPAGAEHTAALLIAFRQDASKARYADWGELMGYCQHSAAPVGRFLLDLFGEDRTLWSRSDALCAALQVLNHVQDCGKDYRALDRLYLPQDWLDADGVTPDMAVMREEIFGPVAPLVAFDSEAEAIALANDTEYGLAAYLYTRDLGRAWRVGEALEYGMVGINEGILSSAAAPFGGVKQSGFGREGSRYGLEDYLDIKYMLMGGLSA